MDRDTMLAALTAAIMNRPLPAGGVLRVGIDGPDAAGKTTLAGELEMRLRAAGRAVIRSSTDRFHNPRAVRTRQGSFSPQGYYEDAFNLEAVRGLLLDPLGEGGDRVIRAGNFDRINDRPVEEPSQTAAPGAILLFDGVFLLRPELRGAFDMLIFVQVRFDTVLRRAETRDAAAMGGSEAARERYLQRYLPAQQAYLSTFRPDLAADVVLINDDPDRPEILLR